MPSDLVDDNFRPHTVIYKEISLLRCVGINHVNLIMRCKNILLMSLQIRNILPKYGLTNAIEEEPKFYCYYIVFW